MVYKLGKILGKGSDGTVYELLGENDENRENNVIKFIQGDEIGIKNYIEYFIFCNLDDNYITRGRKIEIDDGLIKIIFDKADMDLKGLYSEKQIDSEKEKRIDEKNPGLYGIFTVF